MKNFTCFSVMTLFVTAFSFAQPSLNKLQLNISKNDVASGGGVHFNSISPSQAGVYFDENHELPANNAKTWVETSLEIRAGVDEFRMDDNITETANNIVVKKMHQYFRTIKVEHGTVKMTFKAGKIKMAQFEFYSIKNDFEIQPRLTQSQALQNALRFAPASVYEWADSANALLSPNAPIAELVILKDYEAENDVCLAYKFDITTLQPFSSAYIYVNAQDGRIILNNPQTRHTERNKSNKLAKVIGEQELKGHFFDNEKKQVAANPFTADNPGGNAPHEPKKTTLQDYANIQGSAATRFNGIQYIYTDNNSGVSGKPFRLREKRNGLNIETFNLQRNPYNAVIDNYATATDFVDNDNNWTATEFHNDNWDDAALDAHFAMQIVSDYWWTVHNRRGWDNANSAIKSYVHAREYKVINGQLFIAFVENAFWWKKKMSFGDGNATPVIPPFTSFDICAHEMGHAITETTSDLVYQWESGALNESFSDIWAACITDYARPIYPFTNESTWRVGEKAYDVGTPLPGFRDMENPPLFNDPSVYKHPTYWEAASLQTCRDFENFDNCGVHTNSGVLNKWFYLITIGQQGSNYFGTPFNVTGLGFATSEKIAYLTTLNLTPNASYQTCRTVSLNSTAALYGNTSIEYQSVWNAWVAVAVESNIYNMNNTPIFTTNNFTAVGVGKNGVIMAGTNYSGIYKFTNDAWQRMPDLTDVRFNDIKADFQGNFWIAQSGRLGTQGGGSSIGGGVSCYEYPFTSNALLYTIGFQADVPSRNGRCIYVDTFRNRLPSDDPQVWMAGTAYFTAFNSTSGGLGHGVNTFSPYFIKVTAGMDIAANTIGALTLGGNKDVIWTFVQANYGVNQLLTYNAVTNALIETFDHTTHPTIPSGFVARSIYCDLKKRTWIGLASGGILVFDENRVWHYLSPADFPQLFPAGSQASFNAVAGTKDNDVYIGTTAGLLFFERGDGLPDRIDQPGSYRLYGKANGLPSNVINAIAYDTLRFKLIVATDSGVVFWEPLCISPYCTEYRFSAKEEVETIANGNWGNPATWSNGKVPDSATSVTIKHNVVVDIDGQCSYLGVYPSASFIVQTGKKLVLFSDRGNTIYTGTEQRRRRR